ncbi:class E sortase [Rhabdothermincola sediminis]|uniref:class E sortase n=1 Tax=Rhabdothermincola sediminis TaxID=2751370 RepID=UPI001AA06AB1|nr:class E sortase [Rhabdothermincola sediminis]
MRQRTRRLRLAVPVGVFATVVLTGATVAWRAGPEPADHLRGRGAGIVVGSAGRPAPTLAVTTERPSLPIPEALPDNPYAPTPQIVLGTIEIPKLGVVADVQRGVTLTAINRGPGWWPGTARPGGLGNVVIAGHRTTYSKPFARLNELEAGDRVILTTADARFVYEVRGVITVPAEWVDIAAQSWAHTATLFACHPPGSARERIVAKLRLLDDQGRPVDREEDLPPLDAEARRTDHTLLVRPATDPPVATATDPFAGWEG